MRYSLLAGQRALAAFAHQDAVDHFQRALEAKDEHADSSSSGQVVDAETAELLYGLGLAQTSTLPRLELQEAHHNLTRAFDYYARMGDLSRIVAIAEIPGPILSERSTSIGHLTARALEIAPDHSHEAGRLLSFYGNVQGMEEADYQGAQYYFERALAIAKRDEDTGL